MEEKNQLQLRMPVHIRDAVIDAAEEAIVSMNEWMLEAIKEHLHRRRSIPYLATAIQLYTDRRKVGIRMNEKLRARLFLDATKRGITETVWVLDALMSKLRLDEAK